MSVPDEVRAAALAALTAGRAEAVILDLVRDSLLDPPDGDQPSMAPSDVRCLVFGTGDPVVTVEVDYGAGQQELPQLRVCVQPPRRVDVEVLAPSSHVGLVTTGSSPFQLRTPAPGPVSICVTDRTQPGQVGMWRTAWVTL